NSKAFRVFNSRTRIVEENMHVQFSENTPNIVGSGPNWLFDIDTLTNSMNYKPAVVGNQSNGNACTKACADADLPFYSSLKDSPNAGFKPSKEEEMKGGECKKQTVVANSTTEAEYVAASSCCGQVLWIQNQLLDYGYNFMHTKIYIDNESTICIVKNPIFYSKTKHIEIRHHFIRDSNEKKLIQMIKIHTDKNVADLLTKAFDVSRFQYLIASIGMLNPLKS
ncbi:hypothetical protein Tco_0287296, partial [Tanacetum coccineum]